MLRLAPRHVGPLLAAQHRIADALVLSKIRERFGGRIRFLISGSAALDEELARWFNAAGILVLEGYGLTETSAGSCFNTPSALRFGTVGRPLPGTEATIAADGELLLRGPGVMQGYHHRPEATAEAVDADGWMHTGDIAEIDADGFVRITDRKKDLFKTSGGTYVAPSPIESHFMTLCPYVAQIVVHGERRNYCTALIALDPEVAAPVGGTAQALRYARRARRAPRGRRAHLRIRGPTQRRPEPLGDDQEVHPTRAGADRGRRRADPQPQGAAQDRRKGLSRPAGRDVPVTAHPRTPERHRIAVETAGRWPTPPGRLRKDDDRRETR